MREEEEVRQRGLRDLAQEIARARRGDRHDRRLRRGDPCRDAVQDLADGLRRQASGGCSARRARTAASTACSIAGSRNHAGRSPARFRYGLTTARRIAWRTYSVSSTGLRVAVAASPAPPGSTPRRGSRRARAADSAAPAAPSRAAAVSGPGPRPPWDSRPPRGRAAAWRPAARTARGRGGGSASERCVPSTLTLSTTV